jgi:hypothetical protein
MVAAELLDVYPTACGADVVVSAVCFVVSTHASSLAACSY